MISRQQQANQRLSLIDDGLSPNRWLTIPVYSLQKRAKGRHFFGVVFP